jgi:hypothetical protein
MEEKILTSEVSKRIVTEHDLLKTHDISLDDWEIEKKVINTWESSSKNAKGETVVTPMFQVKVWLRSKQETKTLETIRKDFLEDIKTFSPKVPKINYPSHISPYLLELNIFDLHLGKIAWEPETNSSYNLDIAIELFNNSIDEFIRDTSNYPIGKILLPIGNDFFNSDRSYPFNSTTKGTPQEEDARWQHTFRTGRKLLVDNIIKLSQIAPVDVLMVPGNHDFERNFYLGDSLEGWFNNNPNVNIDNSPNPRKYYKYNNILLGFTHGDGEKVTDLPLIMAQENPTSWGDTRFREFHLGHIHHKKEIKYQSTAEYQGVKIRYMSSLSGNDAWHHKKGYIGATRSAEAYLWDSNKGLKSTFLYTP